MRGGDRRRAGAAPGAAALVLAAWVSVAAAAPSVAPAVPPSEPAHTALDVPYMPQPPDLCGGAAVAMVFRYWGTRGITPEEFAPLVRADAAGIPTGVLADAVRARGWSAYPFTGTPEIVAHHLARGRPVIALIAIAPRRFHYVVVVASDTRGVTVHDPAIAPGRTLDHARFAAAWAASGRWAMLVLPPEGTTRGSRTGPAPARDEGAAWTEQVPALCEAPLRRGVAEAQAGRLDAAHASLLEARATCPESPGPWRELAGLALLRRQPAEAASLAARAVGLEPRDRHAWRVLATSRFLLRDRPGALEAWNQLAEPRVDLVRIDGLARTRFQVVGDTLDVAPGHVLTPERLAHAERRLASLPTVRAARVGYRPVPGGLAELDAAVVERPLAATSMPQLAAVGTRALVSREITYAVASATGGGELWHAGWRFWDGRPAVSGGVRLPVARGALRGVLDVTGGWEEQQYAAVAADRDVVRTSRRRVRASLTDWASSRIRWEAAVGLDRWMDRGSHVSLDGALETRAFGDLVSTRLSVQQWAGADAFTRASAEARWRSTREPDAGAWLASGTLTTASRRAPLDAWDGAGTGHARPLLLRAHPLLDGAVVDGAVFGRRVAHATLERRHPLASAGPVRVSLAGFADAARHWDGLRPGRLHVDAGAGLRVQVPGEGVLRIDLARGLRDGAVALSAGWQTGW
jgi:hypothetical protein